MTPEAQAEFYKQIEAGRIGHYGTLAQRGAFRYVRCGYCGHESRTEKAPPLSLVCGGCGHWVRAEAAKVEDTKMTPTEEIDALRRQVADLTRERDRMAAERDGLRALCEGLAGIWQRTANEYEGTGYGDTMAKTASLLLADVNRISPPAALATEATNG